MNPYNVFYPASYGNYQMPQMAQNYQQNQNGIIKVQNENFAREYPVAPGNSVTFMNETEPYFYTKTAGISPLEAAVFKKYRLIEEPSQNEQGSIQSATETKNVDMSEYALKSDLAAILTGFETLKSEIENLKAQMPKGDRKPEKIALNNLEYEGID